jgi:hypothetical protein
MARALALAFVESGLHVDIVQRFGLELAAWTPANAVGLVRRFQGDNGGRGAQEWYDIGKVLVDREDAVAAFARVGGGWNGGNLAALAGLFLGNPGGRTAREWAAIAGVGNALANQENDVAAFARTAGGWNAAGLAALAGAFASNAAGLGAGDWIAIAVAGNTLANQHADVVSFARIRVGWNAPNLATLASLYCVNAGGRTAAQWAAVAGAGGGLVNQENDTALFARIAGGWNAANASALAGLFAANAGGRTAAEWVAMASAHANLANQENDVAALARIANWAPNDLAAMCNAGWTNANLVAFVTQTIATGTAAPALQTLLGTAGFPASSFAMVAAGWTAAQFAAFTSAVLAANATAAAFQTLLSQAGFPGSAANLIAAGWTYAPLGTFLGTALATGVAAATLQGLLTTPGVPASTQAMVAAGWTPAQLGGFAGAALAAGLGAANLQAVLVAPNFPASGAAMMGAGWAPDQFGIFVASVIAAGLTAAQLVALQQAVNFPANSFGMLGAGWTAADAGTCVGAAILATIPAASLSTFLGTGGAAAAGAALVPAANWGAQEVGTTIGNVLTRPGAPSNAQLVWALQRAAAHAWQPGWIRSAAAGGVCGAPAWATLQVQAPLFVANHVAGAAPVVAVPAVVFAGALNGGGYQVSLGINGNRQRHVQEGHTYERFLFTFANCMRNNNGGNIGMLAVGTNVGALVGALPGNAAVQGLADQSAWLPLVGGGSFLQQDIANYRVGVERSGAPVANTYPVGITQYYPRPAAAAANLPGRDLVAIGRLMGHIP